MEYLNSLEDTNQNNFKESLFYFFMKKRRNNFLKKDHTKAGITGGILFAIVLLVLSMLSKYLSLFDGFTNFFLDLFSEFGYDLHWWGLILGVIYSFITGYVLSCLYVWIRGKLKL
jgi:hypothetical protein